MKRKQGIDPELLGGLIVFSIFYVLPVIIVMTDAIQTRDQIKAGIAFLPVMNILYSIICIGDIVYRFFT